MCGFFATLCFERWKKALEKKLTIMYKYKQTFELMTNFSYTFYKVLDVVCQITRLLGFHTGKLHSNNPISTPFKK